jgi:IclR family pca regulon transcriptional regulator
MVSSFAVDIDELCRSCRPIFTHSPNFSHIENNVDIRNHTELCLEQSSSEPGKLFADFGYRNRAETVPSRKTTPPRREAMGGLAKGLAVIRAFSRDHAALSLSDVARSARIPAATARRCLLTLEELGYVTRSGRDFLLRPKVLELGAAYLESMNIEQLTKNHLEELARNTSDSAALCVLDGVEIVYVARTSVRTLLRLEAHVGSRFPAHATSMGRVLLAGVSGERLQRYFEHAKLEALTERTVTDPAKLRSLIEECRRCGYSAVEDELAYGVIALAVPVRDQTGRVVAALNSSSHSRRTTKTKMIRERLAMLQQVSRQISTDLAIVPWLSLSAQT